MATLAHRGSGTPVTSGTTWTTTTNVYDGAVGTTPNTNAVWTSSTSGATAYIECTGHNAGFTGIPAGSVINSVTFNVRHAVNNASRIASGFAQVYDGATTIGAQNALVVNTTTAQTNTFTRTPTLAQLQSSTFKIRVSATRAGVTQSATFSVDYVDVTVDYTAPVPSITQAAYRLYDQGTESGSVALQPQDTAHTGDLTLGDGLGSIRIRLQSTTAVAVPATDDFILQYEKNASGSWVGVPGGSVTSYDDPNLTHAAATTNRLGAGTGSFVAGKVSENGTVLDLGWTANNYTEVLYSVKFQAIGLVDGDVVRFRVLRNGATTEMTYTVTPTVNIIKTVVPPNEGDATTAHGWVTAAAGVMPEMPNEGSAAVTWVASFSKYLDPVIGTASTPDPGVPPNDAVWVFKVRGPTNATGTPTLAGQWDHTTADNAYNIQRHRPSDALPQRVRIHVSTTGSTSTWQMYADIERAGSTSYDDIIALAVKQTPQYRLWTYTSTDGVTWTARGFDDVGATTAIPWNSALPLFIGKPSSAASPLWVGRIYLVELRTGLDPAAGTVLWRFDPNEHAGGTSWVDGSGRTWTLTNANALLTAGATATGKRVPKAVAAAASHTWVTAADGVRTPEGSTSSSHAWATEAAGVAGIVFTPDMLTGLAVWLDASQLGLADGASVVVWSDLSGGNNHGNVVAGSFAPPTLKANTLRGLPVVRFVTQGGKVRGTCPTVTTNLTVVYLVRRWGPTVGRAFTVAYPGSASYNFVVGYHTSSADWMYDNGAVNTSVGWVGDQMNHPTAWRLYGADATSTPSYKSRFFIDGVQTGVDWGGGQGMGGTYNLSGYADTEETMDCEVAEVVIYDHKLSDVERQQVENYLREKWFGPPSMEGTATVAYTETLNSNGRRDPKSSGIVIYAETPVAVGKRTPKAAATAATYQETLTAAGKRTPKAAATTSWSEATVATGKRIPKATMAVSHTWALTAAGVKPVVGVKAGSATVTWTETITAAGKRAPKATATTSYTETLTLAGKRTPKAVATVTHQWTIDVKVTWTPDLLTGLKAWFDASQLALADGANVTLWPDLSGNGLDLTPIAAGRPTYQTNELNGLGVIRFTGAAGEHLTTSNYRTFQHFFLVAKYNGATFANYNGLLGSDSDLILVGGGAGTVDFYSYTQSLYYKNGVSLPTMSGPMGAWAHMSVTKNEAWINLRIWIGSDRGFVDRYWIGDVAEVIGYDHVLSAPERVQVESYLVQKWLPPPKQGTSVVTWAVSSTVVGKRAPKATATPTYTETPVPVGKRTPKATATTSWTATTTATGKRTPKATAATTYVETPAVTGKRTPKSSSTLTTTWTTSAAGKRVARATATTTFRWQTGAAGKRAPKGATVVYVWWMPDAVGTFPANAAGDVIYEFVTLAEGAAGFQMTGLWNGQEVTAMMLGEDIVSNFALTS